jgi:hypothetical protein
MMKQEMRGSSKHAPTSPAGRYQPVISDDALEKKVDSISVVFCLIDDKDVFKKYYSKYLAKRLIKGGLPHSRWIHGFDAHSATHSLGAASIRIGGGERPGGYAHPKASRDLRPRLCLQASEDAQGQDTEQGERAVKRKMPR